MKAFRASLLYFSGRQAVLEQDGLLVVGPNEAGRQVVQALGSYQALAARYPDLAIEHLPGRMIAPGFVDMHIHYPQLDVIGSPADGLLPWLENYTFPHEKRFAAAEYNAEAAPFFVAELLRHGVTTALAFATSHPESVDALFGEAQQRGLRMIAGKVLMDQNAPDGVRDQTEQSLLDTEALINKWQGVDRLGYAITPRFVPSCSAAQLGGAGELAARYPDVWIQSHVAENAGEIAWVRQLYPKARSYLSVYEQFGLLRPRAVYAHCIHIDDEDRALMRATGAAAAVSPTSNLFLGSGFFDYVNADRAGFLYGLITLGQILRGARLHPETFSFPGGVICSGCSSESRLKSGSAGAASPGGGGRASNSCASSQPGSVPSTSRSAVQRPNRHECCVDRIRHPSTV